MEVNELETGHDHVLKVFEMQKNLGALVYDSLVKVKGGDSVIDGIVVSYKENSLDIEFETMFDFLRSSQYILTFPDHDLAVFCSKNLPDTPLDEYIHSFSKAFFAKSFLARLHREKDWISDEELSIVIDVLQKLIAFDRRYHRNKTRLDII